MLHPRPDALYLQLAAAAAVRTRSCPPPLSRPIRSSLRGACANGVGELGRQRLRRRSAE